MSATKFYVNPVFFLGDGILGHALTIWRQAATRGFEVLMRRPRVSADEADEILESEQQRLENMSEALFTLQKSLASSASPLRDLPALLKADELANNVAKDAAVLAMRSHALIAALLTAPDDYPDRSQLEADLEQITGQLVGIRESLNAALAASPESIIRARTAEAAGRLGLTRDEAHERVTRRWRD